MTDRSIVFRVQADIGNLKAQMAQASASVKDAGDRMTGATKQGAQFRQGLDTVGRSAGLVGAVAAAGLGVAVMKAADFEQAMSNVQAATHETAGNMDILREAALEAGASTVFSATEAAAAVENLAKAGVSTADILGGGLDGALSLAAAGELEVADAAEIAATALTQFNLAGADVPHVADLLSAGAGKAQGEVTDLAAALNQSGLVAGQMGVSIEETVGTLSAFASAGLLGSDAGTSFKTMLLRLANPSKEAAAAMDAFGIAAYDANGEMVSMETLAGQLSTAFQGQDQATRDAALATIFGSDAIRAANVLYSQGSAGIAGWTANVNDAGYAAETAAIKMDNLKGDWEGLTGALETALIGTGDGSTGPLRELVQGLTAATNAYNSMGDGAKTAVGGLLGLTAVAGGTLFATAKVVGVVSETREALTQLGPAGTQAAGALGKVGKAAGIATVALAGFAIYDSWASDFEDGAISVEKMTTALLGLEAAKGLPDDLSGLADQIDRLANPNWAQAGQTKIADLIGFGDSDELYEARDTIESIDAALSSMVAGGNADAAAEQLELLLGSLSDERADELLGLLPNYDNALAGVGNAATLAADGTDGLAGSMEEAATAAEAEAAALTDAIDAMREMRAEAIRAFDAETNYHAAIDDANASLKENGRTLDLTTEAGRANRSALSGLASAWNDLSAEEKNANGTAKAARAEFVKMAVSMGMPRKEARELARELMEIPEDRVTDVGLSGANSAIDQARQIRAELDAATKDRHVNVTVSMPVLPSDRKIHGGATRNADGGTVPTTGLGYADRHHYLLADGEEVISNRYGQADKWRPFLKEINAGRLADGGTAGLAMGGTAGAPRSFGYSKPTNVFEELSAFQRSLDKAALALENFADRRVTLAERKLEAAQKREDAAQSRVVDAKSDLTSARSNRASDLDILNQRARVRGLQRDLNAKGDDKLTGLKREIARKELRAAERDLKEMRRSDDVARAAKKALARARNERDEKAQIRAFEELNLLRAEAAAQAHEVYTQGLEESKSLAEAAVSAAEGALGEWEDAMGRVGGIATNRFAPDLFAAPTNVWAEGAGTGPLHALEEAISGLAERAELQSLLALEGLSGMAFEQASSGSNADIRGMLDRGEVGKFAEMWGMYEAAQATTAAQAGQYAYGAEAASATAELSLAVAELKGVQAALDAANATQASIAASTAATVVAVGNLTNQQRGAAVGGTSKQLQRKASHG